MQQQQKLNFSHPRSIVLFTTYAFLLALLCAMKANGSSLIFVHLREPVDRYYPEPCVHLVPTSTRRAVRLVSSTCFSSRTVVHHFDQNYRSFGFFFTTAGKPSDHVIL
ncbi:unnamed protein product, partial [Amoebophrya sp. A120]|eukprot:GSA120T00015052001.1